MELAGNPGKEILPFLKYSKAKALFLFCTQTITIQLLTFIHNLISKNESFIDILLCFLGGLSFFGLLFGFFCNKANIFVMIIKF